MSQKGLHAVLNMVDAVPHVLRPLELHDQLSGLTTLKKGKKTIAQFACQRELSQPVC